MQEKPERIATLYSYGIRKGFIALCLQLFNCQALSVVRFIAVMSHRGVDAMFWLILG